MSFNLFDFAESMGKRTLIGFGVALIVASLLVSLVPAGFLIGSRLFYIGFFLLLLAFFGIQTYRRVQLGKERWNGEASFDAEMSRDEFARFLSELQQMHSLGFTRTCARRVTQRLIGVREGQTFVANLVLEDGAERQPARIFVKRLSRDRLFIDFSSVEPKLRQIYELDRSLRPGDAPRGPFLIRGRPADTGQA